MTFRRYLVLAGVTVFGAAGDAMLSRGMKQVGSISLHHVSELILAILNPWVAFGILLLLAFFAFNKQAFCNYYHFVIGALCCAVAVATPGPERSEGPDVLGSRI